MEGYDQQMAQKNSCGMSKNEPSKRNRQIIVTENQEIILNSLDSPTIVGEYMLVNSR